MPGMEGLLLQVRRPDLTLWGQIPPDAILTFEAELIPGKVGSWKITLGAELPVNQDDGLNAATALASPGWGLVVYPEDDDTVLLSGPTAENTIEVSTDEPTGLWTITGDDDSIVLSDRIAYPTPASAVVADGAQHGTDASGYDQRTGKAGTLLRGYTTDNVGPGAPTDRRIPQFDAAPDLALGADVTGEGRFQPLGDLYEGLTAAGGISHRTVQQGDRIVFAPYVPRDLTATVKLDVANGTLEKVTRTVSRPKITRAIVAGGGEDADRELIEVTTDDSLAAEQLWGYAGAPRRVERFIEASGTDDPDLLPQEGVAALAEEGKTIVAVTIDPIDTEAVQFGRDYYLGDRVSVVIGQDTVQDVIAGVRIVWDGDGLTRRCVLGDPGVAVRDLTLRALVQDRARTQRRLGRLERK